MYMYIYGKKKKSLPCLRLVQNAAARLLTGFNGQYHITPVLASLIGSLFDLELIVRFY